MKNKLLLIYGYLLPIITSVIVSFIPYLINVVIYEVVSNFFNNNVTIIFAFIALMAAITFPFQSSIIKEENPHILSILNKTKFRKVFINASIFQAFIIISFSFILLLLTIISPSVLIGFFELLIFSMIVFESLALISNGITYQKTKEKIIMRVNEAILKKENMINEKK